jgi:hypothetical protein
VFLITQQGDDEWLGSRRRRIEKAGHALRVIMLRSGSGIKGSEVRNLVRNGKDWAQLVPSSAARVIWVVLHERGLWHLAGNPAPAEDPDPIIRG